MQRLGILTWLANMRNGMGFPLYIILEFLFFWDVHVLDLMERWKARTGSRARGWFADLGEWEALCALAKLAGDQPDWVFPTVSPPQSNGQAVVVGTKVGHPLLDESRVCNDVQVGPPGTVLLVTGSNMSGKSTLLRSVGVNIVLAQMGSVVCAEVLSLPPLHIETSMRIADSLADGVSFFMAELKRLKSIVDTAKDHDGNNPKRMLFLLDEILQGTNSRERQIAVSRVVRKLIDENSIGAISTHDLDLATTDELAKACQTVHFAEQFHEVDGKKVMTFDYKMLSGIAETTNALKLLEMVGLGEDSQ
jgi:DNA mismatch repair ATPase MutS